MMFVPNFDVPLIIQKKDGGFGYDSTDLMALKYRTLVTKADWIIYVVDSGQSLHFQQLFEAGRKAGWVQKTRLDHVAFGLVQGKDKKKFKTRSGQNVRLTELLDEACERASAILRKRVENGLSNLSEEETIVQTATQLGIGGVKYFDLRQNRLSDYVFSFDRMLSPEGDTNVYLQYTHARCMSILRKANMNLDMDPSGLREFGNLSLSHRSEWNLACSILRFNDAVEKVAKELMPNVLCKYLYDLCISLNGFYRDCRVIGAPEQNSRLLLIMAAEKVMRQGLNLLGIDVIDVVCNVCLHQEYQESVD